MQGMDPEQGCQLQVCLLSFYCLVVLASQLLSCKGAACGVTADSGPGDTLAAV